MSEGRGIFTAWLYYIWRSTAGYYVHLIYSSSKYHKQKAIYSPKAYGSIGLVLCLENKLEEINKSIATTHTVPLRAQPSVKGLRCNYEAGNEAGPIMFC